jgi:hypothetical protein
LEEKSRFADILGSMKPLPGLVERFRFDELPNGRGFLAAFDALDMDGEEEGEEEEEDEEEEEEEEEEEDEEEEEEEEEAENP